MPNLKISPEQTQALLSTVDHATFQSAIESHWRFAQDGRPTAQSVLWLFCWAKTGRGSEKTAKHVRALFDEILDAPFRSFDEKVDHGWARKMRYTNCDIETALDERLSA